VTTVANTSATPVALSSGRSLPPGERADIGELTDEERSLLATGVLTEVDGIFGPVTVRKPLDLAAAAPRKQKGTKPAATKEAAPCDPE